MTLMMRAHVPLSLCLLALVSCGGDGSRSPAAADPSATYEADVAPDGRPVPLGCDGAVPKTSVDTPAGLLVPPGARVIVASANPRIDDNRITVVEGYVELAPTNLVAGMRRIDGATISFVEDEEIEAEVLIGDARSKNFWKVVRTCEVASRFTALVVSAEDSAAVGGAVQSQTKRGRR